MSGVEIYRNAAGRLRWRGLGEPIEGQTIDSHRPLCASAARLAYAEDLRRMPRYCDGTKRKTWEQLGDVERATWIRNPTPREWPFYEVRS